MRVLELTADRNASAHEIAGTIQNDPALTTKVLRTVNSSFYGLSSPCPSITRATSLLGINTVKSIVLGFSLVDSTKRAGLDAHFDMLSYWRRAVYSAAGARVVCLHTRRCDPEEAFIGGLVQDIGILAFAATLRQEYDDVLNVVGTDHDLLHDSERAKLGVDHCDVGARLAERWRLPPQIVESIRWHHAPGSCNPQHQQLLRSVAVGGMAAAVLADTANKKRLGAFLVAVRDWFEIPADAARSLIQQINERSVELSKSLELKTGEAADLSSLISQAHDQLIATQVELQRESVELRKSNDELARKTITDALTGAFNRAHFDEELKSVFDQSTGDRSPLTIIFLDADRFKSVNDTHGHQAGDAVLIEIVRRLKDTIADLGSVYRYGGEEIAVLVRGADHERGVKIAELLRRRIAGTPFDLDTVKPGLRLPITVSLGVATHDIERNRNFGAPGKLLHAADEGVYAAKQAGRNCVRIGRLENSRPETSPVSPLRVLAVEDDPLAAKLLAFLFDKHREFLVTVVASGEDALACLRDAAQRPELIIADLQLPGISGIELIKLVKAVDGHAVTPCVIVTATTDASAREASLAAGARLFVNKADLVSNFDQWIGTLSQLARPRANAA